MDQANFKRFSPITRSRLIAKAERSQKIQDLLSKSKDIKIADISSATNTSEQELIKVLSEIAKDRKCSENEAFCALALLAQMGAISPRTQDGVKVIINTTEFKIGLI